MTTAGTVEQAPLTARTAGWPRIVPSAVALVVLAAWLYALVRTGSPATDVLHWCGAIVLGILAPGFVVVRSVRRAIAPLVEDLTWAAPAGCLVALTGWFLDRILPVAPAPYIVGPAVVVIGLAVPTLRQRILARPAPGWGTGPSLVLGGALLVAIGWMLQTGLRAYQPNPGVHGTAYYPDIMYQLDLVGELRHALVPTYPAVAGTPLSYHWFLYAIDAHLINHTGIQPFDSTLRLAPATLVPAILMLTAVVARRLSGHVWAGPVAAVLLGVVHLTEGSRWSNEDTSADILSRVWRASPPQTMGWLASMAAAGCLFAFLRKSEDDRAVPVALLIPFFVLTAGSKSSELPVLACGVALAAGVQLLRRDWPKLKRCLLALALSLGVFEAASLTLYSSSSYGVKVEALGFAHGHAFQLFPPIKVGVSALRLYNQQYSAIALATTIALFLLPLMPRLLGLVFQVRYRPGDSAGWVCVGTAVGGFLATNFTRHPAGSEIYFMYSSYPIGVVGAASGLVLAGHRLFAKISTSTARRRMAAWLTLLAALGAFAAAGVAIAQPRFNPLSRTASVLKSVGAQAGEQRHLAWLWWTPTVELYAVLAALGVAVAVVAKRIWPGRRPDGRGKDQAGTPSPSPARRPPVVALSLLTLLLGTGLYTATLDYGGTDTPVQGSVAAVHPAGGQPSSALPTERDAVAAGRYVFEHSGADDVVATNMYCRYPRRLRLAHKIECDTRNFVASALTQRRTLVGGWGYADRIVSAAWTSHVGYRNAPFWDPALLREQFRAVTHPTKNVLDTLYRDNHVRWIFVDLRDKPVAVDALSRLAILRRHGPTTAVWQLRPPP